MNDGTPMKISNTFCILENHVGNIMRCHTELGIPREVVSDIVVVVVILITIVIVVWTSNTFI